MQYYESSLNSLREKSPIWSLFLLICQTFVANNVVTGSSQSRTKLLDLINWSQPLPLHVEFCCFSTIIPSRRVLWLMSRYHYFWEALSLFPQLSSTVDISKPRYLTWMRNMSCLSICQLKKIGIQYSSYSGDNSQMQLMYSITTSISP